MMFEGVLKRVVDTAFAVTNLEGKGFKKREIEGFHWIGYKFFPFVLNIVAFMLLAWILNRVNKSYGFEFAVIVALAMIIFRMK
jgi:hypothetical protein